MITDLLIMMGAYLFGIALMMFIINFLTKGFLLKYLIVKASQNKKILARVHSATDIYYCIGKYTDGFFTFKNRSKQKKSIPILSVDFKRLIQNSLGIFLVDVDETGDKILDVDWDTVKFEVPADVVDNLVYRIKNRPQPQPKREIIIILMLVVIILALLYIGFNVISLQEAIRELSTIAGVI